MIRISRSLPPTLLFVLLYGCGRSGTTTPTSNTPYPSASSTSAAFATAPSASACAFGLGNPEIGSRQNPVVAATDFAAPLYAETMEPWKEWGYALTSQTGLTVVVIPGPATEMELLSSLARGEVHVADLSPIAAGFGASHCWADVVAWPQYSAGFFDTVIIVSRTDTGLFPGDPPSVLLQLEGRTPCYPVIDQLAFPPVADYLIPAGLLGLNGVQTGPPFFMEGLREHTYEPSLETGVFARYCDFATVRDDAPGRFLDFVPGEADAMGVTASTWREQMQVLYSSGPLIPPNAIGLSPDLTSSVRARLEEAIFDIGSPFAEKVEAPDHELASHFDSIVAASGMDVGAWLEKAWMSNLVEILQISPIEWQKPPAETAVIDVPTNTSGAIAIWSSDPLSRLLRPAISAGLTGLDSSGREFAVLARDVPSVARGDVRLEGEGLDEHIAVEYRLRSGLTWHDGAPLTSNDAVFTWRLMSDPAWPFSRQTQFGPVAEVYVSSVEALGRDRVVFRFMSEREAREAALLGGRIEDPSLYSDLADQVGPVVPLDFAAVGRVLLPEHILADVPPADLPGSDFARNPVLAGPYRLIEHDSQGGPVVLEAFGGFALGQPSIHRIVFGASEYSGGVLTSSWQPPDLMADAFQAGAISAQLGLPAVNSRQGEDPLGYDTLEEQGLAGVDWVPRQAWETLDFNLDNPHVADLRVRQAIAHAIDRERIIVAVLSGHAGLMRSYLPDWHPLYAGDAALPDYDYDPEEARSRLEEAGYDLSRFPANHPQRGPLRLVLASMDVNVYPRAPIAEIIRKDLAAIGIEVAIQFYPWPEFEGQDCSAVRNGRRFDLGLAGWLGVPSLYPVNWVKDVTLTESIPTRTNGCPYEKSNWSGWRNEDADALYPTLRDGRVAMENPDLYRQAWAEHQVIWAGGLPSLPLFNSHRPVTYSLGLAGLDPSPFALADGVEDTWNIYEWGLAP